MTTKTVKKADQGSAGDRHKNLRAALFNVRKVDGATGVDGTIAGSRRVEDDPFKTYYSKENLLVPPYDFNQLYLAYEESDILQSCVEAMQQNVDGFGYSLRFLGDDIKQKESKEAIAQYKKATNLFDYINENGESLTTIRKKMREDYEVLGNGTLEVVRNLNSTIQMMYYLPMKQMRMTGLDPASVVVPYSFMRDGKLITVKISKRFHKFCQISSGGQKLRWFREFGDPRGMNPVTGAFNTTPNVINGASEVMHFKYDFGGALYGLPRWIGAVLEVLGRRSAGYINWDLFESQGIPPMAVMVSNGQLTDESMTELKQIILGLRGERNWNRVLLLESEAGGLGLEEKGGAKVELKSLTDYRKEDMMFGEYGASTEKNIRHRFRFPPMYVGSTETFTLATSKAAKSVGEEQVFIPERGAFDEIINNRIMKPELKVDLWSFTSKGPRIVGSEEVAKGVETFAKSGAFSVNHAIDMANESFGMSMSKYDKIWANYPLPLVIKLLESGVTVKGLEEIAEKPVVPPTPEPVPGEPIPGTLEETVGPALKAKSAVVPYFPQKILRSEIFSDEEKKLYKQLLLIQSAVEREEVDEGEQETAI